MLLFEVIGKETKEETLVCRALNNHFLKSKKGLNTPNIKLLNEYISDIDRRDIDFICTQNVNYIAASFVRRKEDLIELKNMLVERGREDIKIVAKIESPEGVSNMDEILEISNAVMVARGDLGVEVDLEEVPFIQKQLIKKCNIAGKPVIVATHMLESMQTSLRPTRAEVSDVANAVYDGTSCVMLSGETATGKYPVEAVRTMAKVCLVTEKSLTKHNQNLTCLSNTIEDFISQAVTTASASPDVKLIATYTNVGTTANLISRYRPKASILAITPNKDTYRQMEIMWGVIPVQSSSYETTDEMFSIAKDLIKKGEFAKTGDKVVVTNGTPNLNGGTNLLKIIEID